MEFAYRICKECVRRKVDEHVSIKKNVPYYNCNTSASEAKQSGLPLPFLKGDCEGLSLKSPLIPLCQRGETKH